MQKLNNVEQWNRKYSVNLTEPINCDSQELKELSESDLVDSIVIVSKSYYEEHYNIHSCLKGKVSTAYVNGRVDFRDGEHYSMVADMLSKYKTGDTVTINGISLDIIGHGGNTVISAKAFSEIGLDVHYICIYSAEKYRPGQDTAFTDFITATLGSKLDSINPPNVSDNSDIVIEIIMLCACFSLAVISFLLLLKYMLDSIMDETAISLIVGASKLRIFLINFCEIMLFSLVNSTIGILLHKLLYNSFFSKINKITTTTYITSDYIYIYLIFNLLCGIVSLFLLLRYARLTPREARRIST